MPATFPVGVDDILATDPEIIDNRYTGKVAGIPCYQDGKVKRLHSWLEKNHHDLTKGFYRRGFGRFFLAGNQQQGGAYCQGFCT